jgi:hypothetical protein
LTVGKVRYLDKNPLPEFRNTRAARREEFTAEDRRLPKGVRYSKKAYSRISVDMQLETQPPAFQESVEGQH